MWHRLYIFGSSTSAQVCILSSYPSGKPFWTRLGNSINVSVTGVSAALSAVPRTHWPVQDSATQYHYWRILYITIYLYFILIAYYSSYLHYYMFVYFNNKLNKLTTASQWVWPKLSIPFIQTHTKGRKQPSFKILHIYSISKKNSPPPFGLKKVTALVFLFNSEIEGTHF